MVSAPGVALMDDDIFCDAGGQFQMLLKGDRLGGHLSVIVQIRFNRFGGGRAKRCFTDLLFPEAARQMMIVQTCFADGDHFWMIR